MQNIVTEERADPHGKKYWMAWLSSNPDNYSLGDTKEQAIAYLRKAIKSRPDIYGDIAA